MNILKRFLNFISIASSFYFIIVISSIIKHAANASAETTYFTGLEFLGFFKIHIMCQGTLIQDILSFELSCSTGPLHYLNSRERTPISDLMHR